MMQRQGRFLVDTTQLSGEPRHLYLSQMTGKVVVTYESGIIDILDRELDVLFSGIAVSDRFLNAAAIDDQSSTAFFLDPINGRVIKVGVATGQVITRKQLGVRPIACSIDEAAERLLVIDLAGPGKEALHIVDSATLNVSRSSRLGKAPYSPSPDTKRRRVFVANTYDQSVSVASYGSLDGDRVIPAGKGPSAIQVSERHGKAFAHVYTRGLLVIDTSRCEVETVVPSSVAYGAGESGIRSENTAIDEEANVLLFAGRSKGAADGFLSVMDVGSGQVRFRLPAGQAPCGLAIDRALHRAYVLNVGTYDTGGYRMTVGFGRVRAFNYTTGSDEGEIALGETADVGRYTEDLDIGRHPVTIVADEPTHHVLVLNSARSTLSVSKWAEQ